MKTRLAFTICLSAVTITAASTILASAAEAQRGRGGGPVRVSLRSKGQVDVAQFAERFGGGGHARAAGLKVDGQFGDVLDQVVTAMVQRLTEQAVAS